MQRRNFLRIIGAAFAAPLMPHASLGAVAKAAPYTPAALHGAIIHAQTRVSISSWSLAQTLGIPAKQASAIMVDMADRGILGQMRGSVGGSQWANSNIFKPQFAGPVSKPQQGRKSMSSQYAERYAEPDLSLMLAHLRAISFRYFAAQVA